MLRWAPLAARICIVVIALIGTNGCSTVHIAGANPPISRKFGLIKVEVPADGKVPILISTEGLGFTLAAQSTTLG